MRGPPSHLQGLRDPGRFILKRTRLSGSISKRSTASGGPTDRAEQGAPEPQQPSPILRLHHVSSGRFQPSQEAPAACQERGILDVRVIHGKGTGALRRSVEALLTRDPRVQSFRPAEAQEGSWGATGVRLKGA